MNQSLMQSIMDGMVSKKRQVDGVPTSLCDLGYCDVGLDDNWQDCKGGHLYHYHDDAGIPIINRERFPDMLAMTSHAHKFLTSNFATTWQGPNTLPKVGGHRIDSAHILCNV